MYKVILLTVTGHCTCQPGAAETTAPARSSKLAVLDGQATILPTLCYSDTGAASQALTAPDFRELQCFPYRTK